MLKLNPDSKRSPFGGHHYPEYGMTFRADSFQELEKKVANFRLHNNIPAGDPGQDILDFYSRNWPYLVREDQVPQPKEDTNYLQWREWIYKTWKNPPTKIVSTKEARDRWAICIACPFNKEMDWAETKESSELTRRTFLLRRGLDTPDQLGFCTCHRADIATLSYLEPAKNFSSKKEEEQPSNCWVK